MPTRDEAIREWFNRDEIKLEDVYKLIRESFEEGLSAGVRWGKRSSSHQGDKLTKTKMGEALDEWCSAPVPRTYL